MLASKLVIEILQLIQEYGDKEIGILTKGGAADVDHINDSSKEDAYYEIVPYGDLEEAGD